MNLIKTILADDHPDALEILNFLVEQHDSFEIVSLCKDGEELMNQVAIHRPELVVTDIHMPKTNGMEALQKCQDVNRNLKFIFVTGYSDYAIEAFDMSAVDYVVKPLELTRLFKALEKAKLMIEQDKFPVSSENRNILTVKKDGSFYYVPASDIYFIEKAGKKCRIHTSKKVYETNEKITDLMKELDGGFFMAHRSNIVNLEAISHVTQKNETYLVYFENYSEHAHISKLKFKEFQERMKSVKR
ncbi:two-component system LytT family response regulator [Bacillus ectoiniformans]|uniref:LytR/AlgR family response regulator transcription factor n=1 Tax=Bacillus ectoiniformans TaxID=1494429 RepID=UPI00195AD23E|nr:LytTR family DNA-binding domain-containing protein [Bacillus ectoiniformans]MBM7648663.1 two-component system LytT family response regulator [Bacillus ectoiniformans]